MESDLTIATICPHCGQRFDLPPDHAGRKLKCQCGVVMTVAGPPEAPVPVEPIPAQPVRVLNYRAPGTARPAPMPGMVDVNWRGFWLPLGMIVVGTPAYLGLWLYLLGWPGGLVQSSLQMPIDLLIVVNVVFLTARFADLELGAIGSVCFKSAAIALLPPAIIGWILASGNCMSVVIAIPVAVGLYAMSYRLLFEIGLLEAALCTAVTLILWIAWTWVAYSIIYPMVF